MPTTTKKRGRPSAASKAAALLGRLGGKARAARLDPADRQVIASTAGLAGGKARAAALTQERRAEIARNAAKARWESQ